MSYFYTFVTWLEVEKRQQYQKFMWSEPREKNEKGLIYMQRKFLEDLGVTDKDIIDKILDENSTDIGKAKGELETTQKKLEDTEKLLEDANKEIEGYKDMDIESVKKSAEDWKQKYEDLEKQKAAEEYDRKIDSYISGLNMNDEVHAEKLKSQIKEKELKFEEDKLIGGDDIVKAYKEKYPHVFETEQKIKGIKVVTRSR